MTPLLLLGLAIMLIPRTAGGNTISSTTRPMHQMDNLMSTMMTRSIMSSQNLSIPSPPEVGIVGNLERKHLEETRRRIPRKRGKWKMLKIKLPMEHVHKISNHARFNISSETVSNPVKPTTPDSKNTTIRVDESYTHYVKPRQIPNDHAPLNEKYSSGFPRNSSYIPQMYNNTKLQARNITENSYEGYNSSSANKTEIFPGLNVLNYLARFMWAIPQNQTSNSSNFTTQIDGRDTKFENLVTYQLNSTSEPVSNESGNKINLGDGDYNTNHKQFVGMNKTDHDILTSSSFEQQDSSGDEKNTSQNMSEVPSDGNNSTISNSNQIESLQNEMSSENNENMGNGEEDPVSEVKEIKGDKRLYDGWAEEMEKLEIQDAHENPTDVESYGLTESPSTESTHSDYEKPQETETVDYAHITESQDEPYFYPYATLSRNHWIHPQIFDDGIPPNTTENSGETVENYARNYGEQQSLERYSMRGADGTRSFYNSQNLRNEYPLNIQLFKRVQSQPNSVYTSGICHLESLSTFNTTGHSATKPKTIPKNDLVSPPSEQIEFGDSSENIGSKDNNVRAPIFQRIEKCLGAARRFLFHPENRKIEYLPTGQRKVAVLINNQRNPSGIPSRGTYDGINYRTKEDWNVCDPEEAIEELNHVNPDCSKLQFDERVNTSPVWQVNCPLQQNINCINRNIGLLPIRQPRPTRLPLYSKFYDNRPQNRYIPSHLCQPTMTYGQKLCLPTY